MIRQIIIGIISYFQALQYLFKRGYIKYILYSGMIGFAVIALIFFGLKSVVPFFSSWVSNFFPNVSWGLASGSYWLSFLLSSIFFMSIFKYIMLICTAPVMSALSQQVESDMLGYHLNRGVLNNVISDILRGLRINIRNIIRELTVTIILLLLSWIPILGLVSGLLILLAQSYYAGFGNADFWAERHFSYKETIMFMNDNPGMLLANGIVYIFILAIPILGVFIAPPLATIAITIQGSNLLSKDDDYL